MALPSRIVVLMVCSVLLSFCCCCASGRGAVAAKTDDVVAAKLLEAQGVKLKRDQRGSVVEVNFRGTSVGDDALLPLAELPRLRSVLLNRTAISDQGLSTLGAIATLQNLDLRGCRVSNAGLAQLTGLSKLREKIRSQDSNLDLSPDPFDLIRGLVRLRRSFGGPQDDSFMDFAVLLGRDSKRFHFRLGLVKLSNSERLLLIIATAA